MRKRMSAIHSESMEARRVRSRVAINPDDINPGALLAEVGDHSAGAVVLFLGTARDHSDGKTGVTHLEYEAYPVWSSKKSRSWCQRRSASGTWWRWP